MVAPRFEGMFHLSANGIEEAEMEGPHQKRSCRMIRHRTFLPSGFATPLLAAVLLAALPAMAAEADRVRIALVGVSAGEGISKKTALMAEEMLLNALHRTERFAVVGRSDIANLIGFEQQKQLVGCQENLSCAAEIAGALGVPYLTSASIGRMGTVTVLSLKIIEVARAKVVARSEVRVGGDADLPGALDRLVGEAVAGCETEACFGRPPTAGRLPPAATSPMPALVEERRSSGWAWTLVGLGTVAAVAAGVVGWQARSIASGDHAVGGVAESHSMTQMEAVRASNLALGANVLAGSAAVLGTGGVVLFVF